jgi:DNA polymerase-4
MGVEERAEESSAKAGGSRKIIHVDMDAFYASVEQRDNPELRGKPVAVGGSRERGVVAAASYEARKFGVHSAMPSITAKRKCPDLIFVKPRFDAYKAISLQIREIFAEYTLIIEPLSLDEAYLDVTANLKGIVSATQIAEEIRARIQAETELTASAGVSYNKFLAKLASDHRKPDGLFVITPKMGQAFVEDPAGQEVSRRRARDSQEDGATRDQDRVRPQRADLRVSAATFRESELLLLLGCARHRRAASAC